MESNTTSVKKLSDKVKDFDIKLSSPCLVIPASPGRKDQFRLEGTLRLDLLKRLETVKLIQFRFVGGVVVSLNSVEDGKFYYGTERLFDQTIIVSDDDHFDPKIYDFPINLSLPITSPPSIFTPNIRIQYLCVAIVGFENGCCGLIPILQQEPLRVKREIKVRNYGLLTGYKDRCVSSEQSLMNLFGNALIWSPNDDFLVELLPFQNTHDPWTLRCQISIKFVIERVDYEIVEYSKLKYT